MFERIAARQPAMLRRQSPLSRLTLGAIAIPLVLATVLGGLHPGSHKDSGVVACAALSTGHPVGIGYQKMRADFIGSRWGDLRGAGIAYANLALALRANRHAYGGEAVWFYERLSTACAAHGIGLLAGPAAARK